MGESLLAIRSELPSELRNKFDMIEAGDIHSIDFEKSTHPDCDVQMTIFTGTYTAAIHAVWDVKSEFLKEKYL